MENNSEWGSKTCIDYICYKSDILKIETHGFDKKHHLGKFNNGMP